MATMATPPIRAHLPDTTVRDISTTGSSWEWDPGLIGATTTGGEVIASADREGDTIIRMVGTIRDIHRMAAIRRITGRCTTTISHPTTVEGILRTMEESPLITVEGTLR